MIYSAIGIIPGHIDYKQFIELIFKLSINLMTYRIKQFQNQALTRHKKLKTKHI